MPEKSPEKSQEKSPHLFCFGLGYSATYLANALYDEGWRISGTHRPGEVRDGENKIATLPFDRDHPLDDFDFLFDTVTHVLISVPPDGAGDPVLDVHGEDIARHAGHIDWLGYLSTVGVYGDTKGRVVDENAPLLPTQERSRFRALAENRWQNLGVFNNLPIHAFRLAGIYGPGRNVFDKIRSKKAKNIIKPEHKFSRIHVDDITNVLMASMANPSPGSIYNVSDDEPAEPAEVIRLAAQIMGAEMPPEITFEEALQDMSDMAKTFWADNRLVNNERIKEELGVTLKYPTYREGLKAIFAEGG
ncbi:MAG: SDR family oxidoreductase [Rhodospirillaceae bacterium]|nr:SDR family oxidoreductase [Rhodospirillaceae bacterium]